MDDNFLSILTWCLVKKTWYESSTVSLIWPCGKLGAKHSPEQQHEKLDQAGILKSS
jgi:hypothetical protein